MKISKRIAIVVCAFPPQGGGIGNNAYYQAKELAKLNYQTTVFTPKFRNIEMMRPISFYLQYLPVWLGMGKAGFLFSLFKELKKFDIIHLYYPFFGTDLIVWLFKIFNKKKKLVLHYEMDPVGQGLMKIIFWFYLKLFLRLLVKTSDKIGVLSWDNAQNSYLKNYLKKYKEKFVEIPNGVDTDIFQSQKKDSRLIEQLKIKPNEKVIIFVGGLDKQHYFKGVDILLKSFTSLVNGYNLKAKSYKLIIVGDGNWKKKYKKQAEKLGIKDRVIFTGWIKNEDLPEYYNLSDVFVLPSTARTESFGIVTAEAQACGLPVVVSNWPGSRSTLKEGETGLLVEPSNVEDLAEKLEKLLLDDKLRKKMSQSARKRVVEKYSWEVVIKKIDEIYTNLKANS